jgi:L-rhamnonate dehydratase
MLISRITTRNVGFSRSPDTLKRHLVTNTSLFEDFETREEGWFGLNLCTLVEVEADDGTIGIGSAGAFHGGAKQLIDEYYAPLLLGHDPRRHEFLWQRMYRTTVRFGRSGSAMCGLSALDIALWDLHGKAEGKPVYDLLGGRSQSDLPCYVRAETGGTWLGQRRIPEDEATLRLRAQGWPSRPGKECGAGARRAGGRR